MGDQGYSMGQYDTTQCNNYVLLGVHETVTHELLQFHLFKVYIIFVTTVLSPPLKYEHIRI